MTPFDNPVIATKIKPENSLKIINRKLSDIQFNVMMAYYSNYKFILSTKILSIHNNKDYLKPIFRSIKSVKK